MRTRKNVVKEKEKEGRVNLICAHWIRTSGLRSSYSFDFLVNVVLRYCPFLFEWSSIRKHQNLVLSMDGKMFTQSDGHRTDNFLSLCTRNMLSGENISVVRWEVTLKPQESANRRRNEWIKFCMGFTDSKYIDEFEVDRPVGGSLHQSSLCVRQGAHPQTPFAVYKEGVYTPDAWNGRDGYSYSYRIPANLRLGLQIDFRTRECVALVDGRVNRTLTTNLPHSIHLAASVKGSDCSFTTTLFDISH